MMSNNRGKNTVLHNILYLEDAERLAKSHMPPDSWNFLSEFSERSSTYNENTEAYKRLKLRPRAMTSVGEVDVSTTLLGQRVSCPIGVSPTGVHKAFHPEGEMATAEGAEAAGSCYIVSNFSNTSYRDLGVFGGLKWAQITKFENLAWMEGIVKMAAANGFKAIVLSADESTVSLKVRMPSRGILKIRHFDWPIVEQLGLKCEDAISAPLSTRGWSNVRQLCDMTSLPVVVKGILTPEDAVLARDHGAAAVFVSNHGGRQLDSGISTIEALPAIVSAVGSDIEVYVDGGIRYGTDVLKALALGAKAVFVGRPVIWGLACGGAQGVEHVLNLLKTELEVDLALTGCHSLKDVNRSVVITNSSKL